MLPYLVLYGIIVLLCFFEMNVDTISISNKKIAKIRDVSFAIIFIYIFLMGVLRNENLGVDTDSYRIYYFQPYSNMPFHSIFGYDSDFGFGVVTWFIARFTNDYWVYRAILFATVFTSISIWIKKYSQCIALSYLVYISLGCIHNDFFLLRLSLAISIYIWSYKYLIERKPIAYYLVVLLAATCHKSALFMVILYPILGQKFNRLKLVIRTGLLVMFVILAKYGAMLLVSLYRRNDYLYDMNSGNGYSLLLYYGIIFMITLVFSKSKRIEHTSNMKGLMLGILYPQVLATAVSLIMRVAYYSVTYLYIILPDVAKNNDRKTGNTYVLSIIILLSIMYFYSIFGQVFYPYYSHFVVV